MRTLFINKTETPNPSEQSNLLNISSYWKEDIVKVEKFDNDRIKAVEIENMQEEVKVLNNIIFTNKVEDMPKTIMHDDYSYT